jgi:hypothetical protein
VCRLSVGLSQRYVGGVVGRSTTRAAVALGVVLVVASGCGWFGSDDSVSSTASDGMRPVPTVPVDDPSGAVSGPAGAATTTILPVTDEEALAPPVTELIGDPQPDPDSEVTLPPLPEQPMIDACDRSSDLAITDMVASSVGEQVDVESISDDACRFVAGDAVAEIHYVSESTVESDWFVRSGIQPVGAVTGDAVGLVGFVPPGSASASGYTIALVSRRQGAIVAVRGTAADRALAEELASAVDGSL